MKTYMIFVSQSNTGVLIHIYALPCTDTFIQKTRKLYMDTRTQRNLSKLNDDLFEVQQIMTRNIQEVLGVGDRLDRMSLNSVHQIVVLPCCLSLWLWNWAWTFMFYINAKTLVSMLTASWTHIMLKDLLNLILGVCDICFLSPCDVVNAEVSQMSSRLSSESRIFADKAKDLNRQVQCSNISPTDTFCFEGLPNCRLALKPVPSFLFFLDCAHWTVVIDSKFSAWRVVSFVHAIGGRWGNWLSKLQLACNIQSPKLSSTGYTHLHY